MRTLPYLLAAAAISACPAVHAQQTNTQQSQAKTGGLGPAVPQLGGIPTLGGDSGSQPAWMPKPPPVSPTREKPITAVQARHVLEAQGYYDIKKLKDAGEGFVTRARRYGKQVNVDISKRGGYVTERDDGG